MQKYICKKCPSCHYRRNMSGTIEKACHWSIDNDKLKPFEPTHDYCDGFKPKGKIEIEKPRPAVISDKDGKIREVAGYANVLWRKEKGVKYN